MTDLHPDDLIDRARGGTLSAAEREQLRLHRAECSLCRFEARLGEDLRTETTAGASSADRLARLVAATEQQLAAEKTGAQTPSTATAPAAIPAQRRASSSLRWLAAASVWLGLIATGFALVPRERAVPIQEQAVPQPPRLAPSVAPVDSRPNTLPSPQSVATTKPTPTGAHRPAARQGPSAASLFAAAVRAREQRQYQDAEQLYAQLLSRYPRSREAPLAAASLGRLLFDQGRSPERALALFESYLRAEPGGALAEQSRFCKATLLDRLGRHEAGTVAWRDLAAHHPDSLHREQARKRLVGAAP